MLIGVISDTHGLLRKEVFRAFEGVELILHAGDIGGEDILTDLETIAPVRAVYGNTDGFPLLTRLPETAKVEAEGLSILLTHIGGTPEQMRRRFPEIGRSARAVIFGHSHRPQREYHQQVLYFNPGAAGPRRFNLPVTVGRLEIRQGGILSAEIVPLLPAGGGDVLPTGQF